MKIRTVRTSVVRLNDDLENVITDSISLMTEGNVLVIASKVVSLCEGNVVEKKTNTESERKRIVKVEAEAFVDPKARDYRVMLTRKNGWLVVDAGVDVSNAAGYYALWPKNPQGSANRIWKFLRKYYGLKKVGVIIADSNPVPLNWSVIGIPLAHCGFKTLRSYKGKKDVFGWKMHVPIVNISHGLAAAAVLEMGEGGEQTPLCVIEDVARIEFQDQPPNKKELGAMKIGINNDIYAPFLTSVRWKKGGI